MNTLKLTEGTKELLDRHPKFTVNWIEGLRSGDYIQVQHSMYDVNIDGSACCLQVMEECCNNLDRDIEIQRAEDEGHDLHLPSCLYLIDKKPVTLDDELPEELIKAVLTSEDALGVREAIFLPAEWNDDLNLTFEQIADLLDNGEIEIED